MEADASNPEYDKRRRPKTGCPRGGLSAVFMRGILKNCLAQRGPDEAAERPLQVWDKSGIKIDNVTNKR